MTTTSGAITCSAARWACCTTIRCSTPRAIQASLADNDLDLQPERVRITALPLSLDELAKMWTAFQTQYRVSAGYRVSVVLIQSALPIRAPLPVLDRGAVADATLDTAVPSAVGARAPVRQSQRTDWETSSR